MVEPARGQGELLRPRQVQGGRQQEGGHHGQHGDMAPLPSIYLVYIYTVSTRYLHSIYTVSTQYLHRSALLSGRVFSCCHDHTSGQHGHSGKLKSPQIVIVEAKSIFITITRVHGLLFYWVYLPTILCVRACVCYVM